MKRRSLQNARSLGVREPFRGFAGTINAVTDLAGRYRDAGVQTFICSAFKNDRETLELLLASDVIPRFGRQREPGRRSETAATDAPHSNPRHHAPVDRLLGVSSRVARRLRSSPFPRPASASLRTKPLFPPAFAKLTPDPDQLASAQASSYRADALHRRRRNAAARSAYCSTQFAGSVKRTVRPDRSRTRSRSRLPSVEI